MAERIKVWSGVYRVTLLFFFLLLHYKNLPHKDFQLYFALCLVGVVFIFVIKSLTYSPR